MPNTPPHTTTQPSRSFSRVAILNRGEPAIRFLRALREYNFERNCEIRAIALFTDPDKDASFVRLADEAYSLGPAMRTEPQGNTISAYCDHAHVLEALAQHQCDALWPGWGFLSEDHTFVASLEAAGIVFLGPSAEAMQRLGDKIASKQLAAGCDVPLAPWHLIEAQHGEDELRAAAEQVGYPLMVKASAGGGGRGIRRVQEPASLLPAIQAVRTEVDKVFGQGGIFLEACLNHARHIEVQFVADTHGNAYALGVRDCSIQRRNQKVIEEAPSPILPAALERQLCEATVTLAQKAEYQGVGTAEYLYIPATGQASFLEVNSRLQVEHTITEALTGSDLVKAQLDIAHGHIWHAPDTSPRGHAIEVRLNAENPERGFQPSPGTLRVFRPPSGPGIRVDSGVCEGMHIAPHFDSMIAKLIAWGSTRKQAIARIVRALQEFQVVVEDGATNKAFLLEILQDPAFVDATADTTWLDQAVAQKQLHSQAWEFEALALAAILEYRLQWHASTAGFFAQTQNGIPQQIPPPKGVCLGLRVRNRRASIDVLSWGQNRYLIGIDGHLHQASMEPIDAHAAVLVLNGQRHQALFAYGRNGITVEVNGTMHQIERAAEGVVKAPAPAVVVHIAVEEGQPIQIGDPLCTLEVMKMEMEVRAQEVGRVRSILCRPNQQIQAGQSLLIIDPDKQAHEETTQTPLPTPLNTPLDTLLQDPSKALHVIDSMHEHQAMRIIETITQRLKALLLGFDMPAAWTQQLQGIFHDENAFAQLTHPARWQGIASLLQMFADVESLFEGNLLLIQDEAAAVSAEVNFYEFCRRHHEGSQALPDTLQPLLQRALAWYNVHAFEPSDALRDALLRMVIAHTHNAPRHQLCSSLLRMTMGLHTAGLQPQPNDPIRHTLERVSRVASNAFPFVADNARQANYILFKQPQYIQRQRVLKQRLHSTLSMLQEQAHKEADVHTLLDTIAASKHSLLPLLLQRNPQNTFEASCLLQMTIRRLYAGIACTAESPSRHDDITLVPLHLAAQPDAPAQDLLGILADHNDFPLALKNALSHLQTLPSPPTTLEFLLCGQSQEASFGEAMQRVVLETPAPSTSETMQMTISWTTQDDRICHRTFALQDARWQEREFLRDVHPAAAQRLELTRLQEFALERLPTHDQIYAFRAQAHNNPKDVRIFVYAEVQEVPQKPRWDGTDDALHEFEQKFYEGLQTIREMQAHQSARKRYHWNRFTLFVRPPIQLDAHSLVKVAKHFETPTRGLGLQKVEIRANVLDGQGGNPQPANFVISKRGRHRLEVHQQAPPTAPIRAMSPYDMKVVRARRMGYIYPYELAYMLEGRTINGLTPHPDMARGRFQEYDLDSSSERLIPVERPRGQNAAGVVVGLVTNETAKFPDGMERVWIASDPTRAMGALAEPECRRILAALDLAEEKQLPVEWLPISAGARIAMDSGTENLDWTARVLKRIVAFTQRGGEINIIVAGVNVGAQSYWNAEATMLMHTRGVLIMTPDASMVLTGKKALEYSGGVAAENERCIGGFDRIMGPNGQAQYFARDLGEAYAILFDHYRFSYRKAHEENPRRFATTDDPQRSILSFPYQGHDQSFSTIGEIFDPQHNPGRKKPFAIRAVMSAVIDQDDTPLERFQAMRHADTAVVWDCHIDGTPTCLIGFESRPSPRRGRIPIDGPDTWTGGTLFPQSSKKVARALNTASGNRPAVILANLSGFDGSPESLRKLQLEMGAEIGRAVVNFEGRILFVVIGRYHGGAYVVFSKALNPNLTAIALEGTYASVIGGAPAAAVVFPHEVRRRTEAETPIQDARRALEHAPSSQKPRMREEFEGLYQQILLEKQGEVAREFDAIHTVERAVAQGSLDAIIPPHQLRPTICNLLKPT